VRVLVTGGAGYIGSVVAERLLEAGDEVAVLDDLSQGHRAAVPAGAAFFEGGAGDQGLVERILGERRIEGVMHFASFSLVGESMQHPFKYLRDNAASGLTLLEAMVRCGVGRFILSSTANLFDRPRRIPVDESEAVEPGSPYGESKHTLERALRWLDRIHGLRYAALRYFNAAGATAERGEDHRPETHLIPLVLQAAAGRRDRIVVYGDDYPTRDGTCVRDYIHVADLASAHILALRALDNGSRAYNLGNGRGFTVKEVIEAAGMVTGRPIRSEIGPRRPGDPAELVACSDLIRKELGWEPQHTDLKAIVASAWEWHRRHPDGYGNRKTRS
jgi:UDP-glucose 4-epimerase